jgi:EF hand
MFGKFNIILALVLTLSGASVAFADAGHHKQKAPEGQTMEQGNAGNASQKKMMGDHPMMDGKHHEMMQMMMQMHSDMMHDGIDMKGGMPRMDHDIMRLMQAPMGSNVKADANGDGKVSAEESNNHMRSMLTIADKDGNGSVTLEEFEGLHNMMMRNRMVDRFQHLDADGNGEITENEMTAPATRTKMK